MRYSHLQLLDLLTADLQFSGVPSSALVPLTSLKVEAEQRAPSWFNSTANYEEATKKALSTQALLLSTDQLHFAWPLASTRWPVL